MGIKSDQTVGTFGCFPGSILGAGRDQPRWGFPQLIPWVLLSFLSFLRCGAGSGSHLVPWTSPGEYFPLRSLLFPSLSLDVVALMRWKRSWCVNNALNRARQVCQCSSSGPSVANGGELPNRAPREESLPYGGTAWSSHKGISPLLVSPESRTGGLCWGDECVLTFTQRSAELECANTNIDVQPQALLLRAPWKPCGQGGSRRSRGMSGFWLTKRSVGDESGRGLEG